MIYKSLLSSQLQFIKLEPHVKIFFLKVFNSTLFKLQSVLQNYFILNLTKMAKVFSNKNSIYYIIRQQWFNKISSEKLSEPRKNLSSFFHQIKFIVSKNVWLKKGLLSYSATSFFFTYIYRIVNFDQIFL